MAVRLIAPPIHTGLLLVAVADNNGPTVTVAVQLEVLPDASLTVSNTVLLPTLLQLKLFGLTVSGVTVPQLSVLPLFTCEGVTVAVPLKPNETVTLWHIAAGGVLSKTCTVAAHDELFPLPSVTVIMTVLKPTLEHV